jgi:hypothetical protein
VHQGQAVVLKRPLDRRRVRAVRLLEARRRKLEVRFDHGAEPLVVQCCRSVHQLFLSRFGNGYRLYKDFTNWGQFFAADNVAAPSVDRVIHHAHVYMLGGVKRSPEAETGQWRRRYRAATRNAR